MRFFVGDVGRPDLLGEEATERLSHQLFETVTRRLATLPDDLIVYPGHTAGSAFGKKIGDAPHTTIGAEKIWNYAFQEHDRDAFVASVMKDMPTPPAYYPILKRVNKQGAVPVTELAEPRVLNTDAVVEMAANGALLVDTRDKAAYSEGHIPGAIFAGFGPNFHAWMGWLAPYDRDIVLITGDNESIEEIVTALHQIGIDRVAGYLDGGMKTWTGETVGLPQIRVEDLAQRPPGLAVLDVRSLGEWDDDHIEGAEHLFLGDITQGETPQESLSRDEPVAIICGSEYRSTMAASILREQGYTNLINVDGGMSAWKEAGLPVTSETKSIERGNTNVELQAEQETRFA